MWAYSSVWKSLLTDAGNAPVRSVSSVPNATIAIVLIVRIAVVEELVFRGYVLTNALEGSDLGWVSETTAVTGAWGGFQPSFLYFRIQPRHSSLGFMS